jgi:RHS repeat-associated protein
LGQLISKNVGGSNVTGEGGLQKVDYTYNIRGWLKQINEVDNLQDDLFSFKINYNDADTATDLFNGNISETYWKTSTDNVKRKYDYLYDDLNRLLQADYSKQGNTAFNSYLEHLTYDKNGNIKSLQRNGGMDTDGVQFANPIDNLMYFYDTNNKNLLVKVFDATANPQGFADDTEGVNDPENDYKYDDNGNMTKDDNKKIQNITYNHLNLPTKITFVNGNTITYLYNAAGQKVNKVVTENSLVTTTEYLNGFQYVNSLMQFFPHAEGYVNATQNGAGYDYKYVFNYTDHLGNIRLSYAEDPTSKVLKIIEENHYYPFGLKHSGYNSDKMMYVREALVLKIKPVTPFLKTSYDYKYNGKEWQDELGLNVYDYGFRNYDPALGRWMNIDPLAEESRRWTPYNYAYNNPIYFIDPDGQSSVSSEQNLATRYVDPRGNTIINTNDGSNDVFIVPWADISDFKENIYWTNKAKPGGTDGSGWNSYWRGQFQLAISHYKLSKAGYYGLHSEEAKSKAIKFLFSGSSDDFFAFEMAEIRGQWSDPLLVSSSLLGFAHGGVSMFEPGITATAHGEQRLAGANATRGGVLSASEASTVNTRGSTMTQADGAVVKVLEVSQGRYNVTVSGERGLITTFKNLSEKSLNRLSNNYGWKK